MDSTLSTIRKSSSIRTTYPIATDSLDNHISLLSDILSHVTRRLELNIEKCKFAQIAVDFLGYSAITEGIRPIITHIPSIKVYPAYITFKQLRVWDFSLTSGSLFRTLPLLLIHFEIDDDYIQAFKLLK